MSARDRNSTIHRMNLGLYPKMDYLAKYAILLSEVFELNLFGMRIREFSHRSELFVQNDSCMITCSSVQKNLFIHMVQELRTDEVENMRY